MLGDDQVLKAAQRKKNKNKNKNNNDNNRRFSDDQIKSLESLFKMENKLEPRKKLEMARELGLHPRQVAIWFQNRRARWKSKQVEQDYTTLKADYDSLSDRFESLKNEKHALLQQLRNLCNQLKEGSKLDLESGSENGDTNCNGPLEQDMVIYSDEDDPIKHKSDIVGLQKQELDHENIMNMEGADDEIVSNFDLGSLFDHFSSSSNWWEV